MIDHRPIAGNQDFILAHMPEDEQAILMIWEQPYRNIVRKREESVTVMLPSFETARKRATDLRFQYVTVF
jgi:hypothetical protein